MEGRVRVIHRMEEDVGANEEENIIISERY